MSTESTLKRNMREVHKYPLYDMAVGESRVVPGMSRAYAWRAGQLWGRSYRTRLLTTGRQVVRVA